MDAEARIWGEQEAAKPIAKVMAEGLRDRLCHIWRRQLGPFLYRKMQRVCCMGRTILITSQFLQFLRQSTAKYNATYRSDIQMINTPGAQGADNRFLLSMVQTTMQSLALQCVPRGEGGQGESPGRAAGTHLDRSPGTPHQPQGCATCDIKCGNVSKVTL